jgi:hypothetical protein
MGCSLSVVDNAYSSRIDSQAQLRYIRLSKGG